MSLSNENNMHCVVIDLGSPSGDLLIPGMSVRKDIVIENVDFINGAAIAASDTDFIQLDLRSGSTVIAELDSREAHEDGIEADVAKALNIVAAEAERDAGETLTVNLNETDAGTNVALTDAKLCVWYRVK